MSKGNDRRNDGHALRVARHGDDERAVDLERGDRQFREVRERRITRAEVVDRDLQAHLPDRGKFWYVFFYIPHDEAFGDFKIERTPSGSCFLDGAAYGLDEVPLPQLNRRHVDRDARWTPVLHAPTAGVLQCFAYRPLADLQDHPGFLEYGDELYGRDQSRFRILPPDQGLEPGDAAAPSIHFRLIVQDELIQFDRLAKLVLEQQGLRDPRMHFRTIEQILFSRFLGLLQRGLGLPPESIVDKAKAIDVAGCDDDLGTAVLGRMQKLRQPFVKQRPIGKARKRVIVGQVGEPLLPTDVLERERDVARKLH